MDLKDFEYRKNIKDVRYWKEEYELKKEMIFSIENMFNNALEEFLNKNPQIKNKWDVFMSKKSKQIEEIIKQKFIEPEPVEEFKEEVIEETYVKKELTPKEIELKRIYREIVKLTHPDKISSYNETDKERRLKIYKESILYYDTNDLSNIIYSERIIKFVFILMYHVKGIIFSSRDMKMEFHIRKR